MYFAGYYLFWFLKEFTKSSIIPNKSLNYFKLSNVSINSLIVSKILWNLSSDPSKRWTVIFKSFAYFDNSYNSGKSFVLSYSNSDSSSTNNPPMFSFSECLKISMLFYNATLNIFGSNLSKLIFKFEASYSNNPIIHSVVGWIN